MNPTVLWLAVYWCFAVYVLAVWCEVNQSSEHSPVESAAAAAATTELQPSSSERLQEGEHTTHNLQCPHSVYVDLQNTMRWQLICDSESYCAETERQWQFLQEQWQKLECLWCLILQHILSFVNLCALQEKFIWEVIDWLIDLILLVPFFTVISVSFLECSLAQGFNLSVRDKCEQNKHSDINIRAGEFSCSFNTWLLGLEKMYCVIKTISEIINNENNLLQLQRKSE